MELTILMPCLNEAAAVVYCVKEAAGYLAASSVEGEILVADNGSTDGSPALAASAGARVVSVPERGYGSALRGGIAAARGTYVIMADCDGSYDFSALDPFLQALRQGSDLVVGDRYRGGFAPGASPWSHRCLGVPLLSLAGRLTQRRWHPEKTALVHDFHCGLRGVRRDAFLSLGAQSTGMEFASEMILLATRAGQTITQTPAVLRRDRRNSPPHLRAVPDALRHLRRIAAFWM